MITIKKVLKWFFLFILGTLLICSLVVFLFLQLSPQFGGSISEDQKSRFAKLDHYKAGIFINYEPFEIKTDCHSIEEMLKDAVSEQPHIRPERDIKVVFFDINQVQKELGAKARAVWLGHSSFLLEIEGKTILIDPVFSDYAAPHPWLGRKRYNSEMPFDVATLKEIDAVIISHDHYDHLDYSTIQKIKHKIKQVIVPLGVGNHFKAWGINSEIIHELDWWEETILDSLKVVLTPSRHSSGRGINDQSATLWGSWCFLGSRQKIFFSGDGGYGKHFKEIGQRFGPFDFGMIECGQYDKHWAGMHMVPEESVQAGLDVKARSFMPIHWGAFTLANHTWVDPVERFKKKALELKANISTPEIGEVLLIQSDTYSKNEWWKKFD